MSSSPRPREYRSYRAATYVTYVLIVAFLTSLPMIAVVRGLVAEARVTAPPREPIVDAGTDTALSKSDAIACLEAFQALREEADSRFGELGVLTGREGRQAMHTWADDSRLWETTLASLAEECRVGDPEAGPNAEVLAPVAISLERVGRAYNTHATRLVLEDGSLFEDLSSAFSRARSDLGKSP